MGGLVRDMALSNRKRLALHCILHQKTRIPSLHAYLTHIYCISASPSCVTS